MAGLEADVSFVFKWERRQGVMLTPGKISCQKDKAKIVRTVYSFLTKSPICKV